MYVQSGSHPALNCSVFIPTIQGGCHALHVLSPYPSVAQCSSKGDRCWWQSWHKTFRVLWPMSCMFNVITDKCEIEMDQGYRIICLVPSERAIPNCMDRLELHQVGWWKQCWHVGVLPGIINYEMFPFVLVQSRYLTSMPTIVVLNTILAFAHTSDV